VRNLSLCIEELLLLKLYAMFGPGADTGAEVTEESDFETQRRVMDATSVHAIRYYFATIQISLDQVNTRRAEMADRHQETYLDCLSHTSEMQNDKHFWFSHVDWSFGKGGFPSHVFLYCLDPSQEPFLSLE